MTYTPVSIAVTGGRVVCKLFIFCKYVKQISTLVSLAHPFDGKFSSTLSLLVKTIVKFKHVKQSSIKEVMTSPKAKSRGRTSTNPVWISHILVTFWN